MPSLKLAVRRILYYRDLKLLFHIFLASLKFPIFSFPNQKKKFINKINREVSLKRKKEDKDKITKYVGFYSNLLRILGFRNTCLTRSVLLCYVLRKFGFNARLSFGIEADPDKNSLDPSFLGHCWVSVEDDYVEKGYETISRYP